MTERPELVYDAPKRQYLYEWQIGEYHWVDEPVFDRTREYVEALETENAELREKRDNLFKAVIAKNNEVLDLLCENEKLRELVRDMWRFTGAACKKYQNLFNPAAQGGQMVQLSAIDAFEQRMSELGVEVGDGQQRDV